MFRRIIRAFERSGALRAATELDRVGYHDLAQKLREDIKQRN